MLKTTLRCQLNRMLKCLTVVCVAGCIFSLAQTTLGQAVAFDQDALKVRDSILFRSGSRLYGIIKSEGVDDDGRKYVVFESDDKTVMKLDVSRLLSKPPEKMDSTDLAYNKMVSEMPDTAEAHRDAYKWCEDQPSGTVKFKNQIKFHCERVMELDPNDTAVKHRLGYQFIDEEDRWVPLELYHQSLGYEKKGTSWAPTLRRYVEGRADQTNAREAERRTAYRKWKNMFKKKGISAMQLQNELFRFCDEYAIRFLLDEAKEEKDPRVLKMYVEAFGKVSTYAAMESLIYFAIEAKPALADQALDLLRQEHYNQAQASARIAGQYFSDTIKKPNFLVQRAAFAIGELGSESAILPLIGVLITEHIVAPGEQPGRMKTGIDSNGIAFSAGGDTNPKKLAIRNNAVVGALKKITNQDFQFSSDAWKHWYIENHTLHDATLRPTRR